MPISMHRPKPVGSIVRYTSNWQEWARLTVRDNLGLEVDLHFDDPAQAEAVARAMTIKAEPELAAIAATLGVG